MNGCMVSAQPWNNPFSCYSLTCWHDVASPGASQRLIADEFCVLCSAIPSHLWCILPSRTHRVRGLPHRRWRPWNPGAYTCGVRHGVPAKWSPVWGHYGGTQLCHWHTCARQSSGGQALWPDLQVRLDRLEGLKICFWCLVDSAGGWTGYTWGYIDEASLGWEKLRGYMWNEIGEAGFRRDRWEKSGGLQVKLHRWDRFQVWQGRWIKVMLDRWDRFRWDRSGGLQVRLHIWEMSGGWQVRLDRWDMFQVRQVRWVTGELR